MSAEPWLLEVEDLVVRYPIQRGLVGGALEDALNPRLRVAHLSARSFRLRPLVGRGKDAL